MQTTRTPLHRLSPHRFEPQTASPPPYNFTATRDDDIMLVRRVAAQEQQAFRLLYSRYAPRLASFLSRRLHPPELVDDVLHEVMLALWQQAAHFDPTKRLSTWLLGIARHKAISAMRAAKLYPNLSPVPSAGSDLASPEVLVYGQERARTVAQALEQLPPEQRIVVELTYYQACSPQEIAARTGVGVHTVRSRLRLAHRRLASTLAAFQEPKRHGGREGTCMSSPANV